MFMSVRMYAFERWCLNPKWPDERPKKIVAQDYQKSDLPAEQQMPTFWSDVKAAATESSNIQIDTTARNQPHQDISEELKGVTARRFNLNDAPDASLQGAKIGLLNVMPRNVRLELVNCEIGVLSFHPEVKSNVTIKNCKIGNVKAYPGTFSGLEISRSGFLNFDCPQPGGGNPFTGSVSVDRSSYFMTHKKPKTVFAGSQCYTSVRVHLEELQNAPAAARFRALELDAERQFDTGITWLTSSIYKLLANYGLSPGRPLFIAMILYLTAIPIVYAYDGGGSPGMPSNRYQGYLSSFTEECQPKQGDAIARICESRMWRSAFLPFQAIGGPIVLFSANKLVVPNKTKTAVALGAYGIVMDLLLFLSILSLRRRFKLT